MLAFTNNSSPLFIIGTVGISLFGDIKIGIILFITHILSCLSVGLIFGFISKLQNNQNYNHYRNNLYNNNHKNYLLNKLNKKIHTFLFKTVSFKSNKFSNYNRSISQTNIKISNLGTILSTSINNAISTILLIGGFIVLFSIIISIINNLNIISYIDILLSNFHINTKYSSAIFTGLIELTNGINLISSINEKKLSIQIIITSFLLGCAGLSIFLQIFSIASVNNLSMKPYFLGKLLQGCLAALYTYIILNSCNFFYFDLM